MEKYLGKPPFQYWPCDMCDRKLKMYKEFGELSQKEYDEVLLEIFSYCTQDELERGLGSVKKPKHIYYPDEQNSITYYQNNSPSFRKESVSKSKPPIGKFCIGCGKTIGTGHRIASNLGSRIFGGFLGSAIAGPIGGIIGARYMVKENAKERKCYECQ